MSRIMKVFACLVVAATAVTVFSGCQLTRTPLTSNGFKTKAEAAGYTTQVGSDNLTAGLFEGRITASKGNGYRIEFGVALTEEIAKSFYQDKYTFYEANKESSPASASHASAVNFEYFYLIVGDRFCETSRTENTIIYVSAPEAYASEIKQFLKDIGY